MFMYLAKLGQSRERLRHCFIITCVIYLCIYVLGLSVCLSACFSVCFICL